MLKYALLLALVAGVLGREYSVRLNPRDVDEAPEGRIFGGNDAAPGQFPHQVSVQLELTSNNITVHLHNCGGSILNEWWILTAAHCIVGIPDYETYMLVVAGEHNFKEDEGTEQRVHVERLISHENYPNLPLVAPNDIGLMKLSEPLVFNEFVQPIALPAADVIPSGKSILSGWGAVGGSIIFPVMPSILQTANLPLISYDKCLELYEDSPLNYTNICTGPLIGGVSACSGDSGGPLIQQAGDGSTTVIGIVSWGTAPCALPNAPSVYTRVSAFIDWIEENMV